MNMMEVVSLERYSEDYVSSYQPPKIAGDYSNKHILTVEQFTRADLDSIFQTTNKIREGVRRNERGIPDLCANKVLASLFFESSTRTDVSFQAAMARLGGRVISASNGIEFSSMYKGENLADTVRAIGCYADAIVLRHPQRGASYQAAYYLDLLYESLGQRPVLMSAGDGVGEHPTQALLDLYTLLDCKKNLDGLNITIVGDLKYGRTVHSLAKLMGLFDTPCTTLHFVSPPSLRMPQDILDFLDANPIQYTETDNLDDVLADSDAIYWTRIQEERFDDPAEYAAIQDDFILSPKLLEDAKSDCVLMHPLPRKHEMGTILDHDILDQDPRAVYFKQMQNGMFIRMALLAKVLGTTSL